MIARAPGAPSYGSPEWCALPESSPAKVAAVVIAAESWARDGDELEERLRHEVLALSRANKQAEDGEYVAQMNTSPIRRPAPAELEAEFWEWIRGDVA
ncbi:hypothetical protein GCM10009726_06340 [Nocardioides furvisabuli]|uniref:Uncharacterized protein n=2 Tax=Nocardioides furvisabuli TaxID=375542 RepID=A0ABP5IEN6_9ACTN